MKLRAGALLRIVPQDGFDSAEKSCHWTDETISDESWLGRIAARGTCCRMVDETAQNDIASDPVGRKWLSRFADTRAKLSGIEALERSC